MRWDDVDWIPYIADWSYITYRKQLHRSNNTWINLTVFDKNLHTVLDAVIDYTILDPIVWKQYAKLTICKQAYKVRQCFNKRHHREVKNIWETAAVVGQRASLRQLQQLDRAVPQVKMRRCARVIGQYQMDKWQKHFSV